MEQLGHSMSMNNAGCHVGTVDSPLSNTSCDQIIYNILKCVHVVRVIVDHMV